MQRLKALDELTPADLWREVPRDDEEFWSDARERQQRLVKVLIEGALEEEMTLLLGAGRYRRSQERHGYRNGFYERDLATQIGIVTAIRVPRPREGSVEHSVFSRYQRRQEQVNDVIRNVFLAGVSTRRVGESLEAILGEPVSAQATTWPPFRVSGAPQNWVEVTGLNARTIISAGFQRCSLVRPQIANAVPYFTRHGRC